MILLTLFIEQFKIDLHQAVRVVFLNKKELGEKLRTEENEIYWNDGHKNFCLHLQFSKYIFLL